MLEEARLSINCHVQSNYEIPTLLTEMCALPVPLLDHLHPVQDDLSRDELRNRNGAETQNMLITTPAPDRVGKHGSRLQGGLLSSVLAVWMSE